MSNLAVLTYLPEMERCHLDATLKRAGYKVVNVHETASSAEKGESDLATVQTILAMNPNLVIIEINRIKDTPR